MFIGEYLILYERFYLLELNMNICSGFRFLILFLVFLGINRETFSLPDSKKEIDTTVILEQFNQGIDMLKLGRLDSAHALLKKSLDNSRYHHYLKGEILSLAGLGHCARIKGEHNKAQSLYFEGLHLLQKQPVAAEATLYIYGGLGEHFFNIGKYDSAYYYFLTGLKIVKSLPVKNYMSIGMFYNNLSAYWVTLGKAEKALQFIDEGLGWAKRGADTANTLIAMLLNNKAGILNSYYHNRDSALFYLQKVLDLGNVDSFTVSTVLYNMGVTNLELKKTELAIKQISASLSIRERSADYIATLSARTLLGSVYLQVKDYANAELHLSKVYNDYQSISKNRKYLEVLYALGQLYKQTGRAIKAYDLLDEAYLLKDTILSEQSTQNINELDVKYRTAEKDRMIAEKALEINRQKSALKERNLLIAGLSLSAFFLVAFLVAARKSYRTKRRMFSHQILVLQKENQLETLKAMMKGEEQERSRLAREIHDGIGGMLAGIKMNVNTLYNNPQIRQNTNDIESIMGMVEHTVSEVRRTAHNLMPDMLMQYDFQDALRIYCDNINNAGQLEIDLQFHSQWEWPDKTFELSVYRILQELIQNTLRHAEAGSLVLQFRFHDDILHITVEDDGKGFDTQKIKKGLGISNIHARIKLLSGIASIESQEGEGTSCYLEFNFNHYKKA